MDYFNQNQSRFGLSGPLLFVLGVVVGILLGWVFEGIVSILIRLSFVALLVVAGFYLFNQWRGRKNNDPFDGISDADWRDLNSRRRR